MAVQAIRAGAADFIEKPTDPGKLLACIDRALKQAASPAERSSWHQAAALRLAGLTKREREVMELVVAGYANKRAPRALPSTSGLSRRTGAAMMRKMGASSLSELVRLDMAARAGNAPSA